MAPTRRSFSDLAERHFTIGTWSLTLTIVGHGWSTNPSGVRDSQALILHVFRCLTTFSPTFSSGHGRRGCHVRANVPPNVHANVQPNDRRRRHPIVSDDQRETHPRLHHR